MAKTFLGAISDGWIGQDSHVSWAGAHDAVDGYILDDTGEALDAAGFGYGGYWYCSRSFLSFDTSSLGPGLTVNAFLAFYFCNFGDSMNNCEENAGYATLHVVEGVQHDPLVLADYGAHLAKTISGGSIAFANIVLNQYNIIALNATGRDWINRVGVTKFCLRLAGDKDNVQPVAVLNRVIIASADNGVVYAPKLTIVSVKGNPNIDQLIYQHAERMKR